MTMPSVIPHLNIRNAREAIDFYVRAFGAEIHGIMDGENGKVMHAAFSIDGGMLFATDEYLDWNVKGPEALGGSPVTIHLHSGDADAKWARATEAGCTVIMPLELQFWGDKYGMLRDPYGHQWSIGQTVEEKTPEQIRESMAAMESEAHCGPEDGMPELTTATTATTTSGAN